MSNFAIYLIGTVFVAGGLSIAGYKLGVPAIWIITGVIIILGMGIMGGVLKTRRKEKPDSED